MNIAYLLADNEPSGGIRVVLAQADALVDRGHDVTLITTAGPVTWRPTRARYLTVPSFRDADASAFDFVVGTFWTTVPEAHALAGDRAVHLCQGYEGAFTAYAAQKPQIDAVYRLAIPKITVSLHLVDVIRQFHDDATHVGQIVDEEFYRAERGTEHSPPRVIVCGQAQADMKGIDDAYAAVRRARAAGVELHLVRVSSWIPAENEPVAEADEFHVSVPTAEMTTLMHSCDVLVAPNHHEEGFGLPAAEALASRIPVVMTAIPSYLSLDTTRDYALFAPQSDGNALGDRLIEMLTTPATRDRLAARGAAVAEQFRAERIGANLEAFFSARARTRTSGR